MIRDLIESFYIIISIEIGYMVKHFKGPHLSIKVILLYRGVILESVF